MSDEVRVSRYFSSYHHPDLTWSIDLLRSLSTSPPMDTDTTDTTGQQDKALDLALKDVLKKRDDLVSRLSSSKGKVEDGSAAVIGTAVDAIAKIYEHVQSLSSKLETEEKKIKEHGDNLKNVLPTVKSDIEEQAEVLEQLVQVTRLLEFKAIKYKGSHEAIVVRRHLDDIRAAVAQGFILVMSDYFINDDLINRYDPQNREVIWWKFTDQVVRAWESCYQFQQLFDSNEDGGNEDGGIEYVEDGGNEYAEGGGNEHVDDRGNEFVDKERRDQRFRAIQDKSVFSILMKDLPYKTLFDDGRCVFICDGRNRAVLEYEQIEEGSATLARQLRFFAPIFIWKFTETKRDILMCSQQVQDFKDRDSSFQRTLELMEAGNIVGGLKFIGEQSPPKGPGNEVSNNDGTGDELAFGTAQELRRKPELGAILRALPRFSPPGLGKKAQLKRKSTSDGNAYRGSRPRFEADVSTSIRSYAAEGLEKVHSTYPDEDQLAQIAQDPPKRTSHPQALQSTSVTTTLQHTKEGTVQQQRENVLRMREAENRLARAKRQFDMLRKCLHILLSDNILRLAVTGPSVLRNALNYLVHSRHAYDKDYEESIRDVEQLLERVQKDIADKGNMDLLAAFDKTRQDEKEIAHGKKLEEAHRVLMESDYFAKDDVSTEKEIDIFIETQLLSRIDATNPDYLILLQWMESVNPAQTDQEPKTTDSKGKGKAT
ncbi:hypothetical protein ACEPAG_5795 [Sanghuangporus baumii]